MKRVIATFAALAIAATAISAQNLGSILGGLTQNGNAGNTLGNILNSVAGAVYSAPVSLDGTYTYNGVAVSVTKSEGGVLSNLAGTAVTSTIETKIDEQLAKFGVKPGAFTWVFNSSDNTFTCNIMGVPLNGTYKVGDGENTVNLTFGKKMKYLSMTGTLKSGLNGCEMLFTADKMLKFLKKAASLAGKASSSIGSILTLVDGYDQCKIGVKLVK